MPNLARPSVRPQSPPSKVLLVRQPVRSVRRGDELNPLPMRLAIGVIVALGAVGLTWLVGFLGFRLGFAPLVRVPGLVGEPGQGLAAGARMIIAVPRLVFQAGLAQPTALMIGFLMIAIPAGSLAAARPRTPGGPRQNPAISAMATAGGVAAMINGAAIIWWAGSPMRTGLLRVLPLDPTAADQWYTDLQTAAGLDVLAVVAGALWVVLVMRLPIALWLRAISASAAFFSLVVVTVALAISTVTATQVGAPRALCQIDDFNGPRCIILGSTPRHAAVLTAYEDDALVQLRNREESVTIMGQESIVSYLSRDEE